MIFKEYCKNFIIKIVNILLLKKFSKKNFSKLFYLGLVISCLICSLDLVSKKYVFKIIDQHGSLFTVNQFEYKEIKVASFFSLVKVLNTGVSFGMFSKINNSNIIFAFIQGGIAIALLFWMYQVKNLYLTIALSLVIGGALGNTIDRIINGAVADFLDFYIGNYHWPAFNLADSAIFVGISMLLIEEFFLKNNQKNNVHKKI